MTIEEKIKLLFDESYTLAFVEIRNNVLKTLQEQIEPSEFEVMMNFIIKEFKIELFFEKWVDTYKSIYTEEEIDYLIEQRHSPIWNSIMEKSPIVSRDFMDVSKRITGDLVIKYQREKENY